MLKPYSPTKYWWPLCSFYPSGTNAWIYFYSYFNSKPKLKDFQNYQKSSSSSADPSDGSSLSVMYSKKYWSATPDDPAILKSFSIDFSSCDPQALTIACFSCHRIKLHTV